MMAVGQLRYEFPRRGEDRTPPSVAVSNKLYEKLCRRVWSDAFHDTPRVPCSAERVPRGRGLQYLQRWAREDGEKRREAYKVTLASMKTESTEKWGQW